MQSLSGHPRIIATALVAFALAGCDTSHLREGPNINTPLSLVPHCIGRYVIDLPGTVRYVGSANRYRSQDIEIEQMDKSGFDDEVEIFERKLQNTKHAEYRSLLMRSVGRNTNAPVFAYWGDEFTTVTIDIAGYRWVNGFRYLFQSDENPDRVEVGTRHVSDVIERLRARREGEPSGSGFCIWGALLADENDSDNERTSQTFQLQDKPDVQIAITTSRNGGQPPETLLSRLPGVYKALGVLGASLSSLHTIREADRTIASIFGQEWLVRAPNDYKFQGHVFTWEAPGKPNSVLYPQIRVELRTARYGRGVPPGPSSLTDAEALQLWDQILGTLRLRPTGDKPTTQPVGRLGHASEPVS